MSRTVRGSTINRFDPGTGPDGLLVSPGTKKRKRVRSEYYEDELIDLTTDDLFTIWRDIVRTLITMFKALTAGSYGWLFGCRRWWLFIWRLVRDSLFKVRNKKS